MALKHAPFCTRCGEHRTLSPTGLCSHCRRRPIPQVPCKFCRIMCTNHETGLCFRCRRNPVSHDKLGNAIEIHKRILTVLELRPKNCSYGEIAKRLDMSKAAVNEIYRSALQLPTWAAPNEE